MPGFGSGFIATRLAQLTPVPVGGNKTGSAPDVFRPGCAIRLLMRLEDFSNDDGPGAQREGLPVKEPHAKAAAELANLVGLQAVIRVSGDWDPAVDAQVEAARKKTAASKSGKTSTTNAAAPLGSAKDAFSAELGLVPLSATLCLNGFRTADKVSFELALADLPLGTPEILRSALVEVFMDEIAVDDFGTPERWFPRLFQSAPLFRGYVDEDEVTGDETSLRVTISALSLEQRLMSLKIDPFTHARRIDRAGEPVTRYIQKLIGTIPEFNGSLGDPIGVRIWPNFNPLETPVLNAKMFKRSLQSAQSRAQAGGQVQGAPPTPPGTDPAMDQSNGTPAGVGFPAVAPQTADVSVWDVITRAAELSGLIPVYDPSVIAQDVTGQIIALGANNILLVPPQNIKETPQGGVKLAGGSIDGFGRDFTMGGTVTVHSDVRFMVWGDNIKKYRMARKYSREKAPRIHAIAHNPDAAPGKRTLHAYFPDKVRGTSVSAVGSGQGQAGKGHQPIEEEVVRLFNDIRDIDTLKQAAVALFHSIGRREMTVNIDTADLASYTDPTRPEQRSPDLLRLRPGTPVRILTARQVQDPSVDGTVVNGLSELMDRRSNPAFLRHAILDGPNGPALVASEGRQKLEAALSQIEQSLQSGRLTDWFYTRTVELRFSKDDGFNASIELANYVEARNDPRKLSPDDKAANDATKASLPDASSTAAEDARADAITSNIEDEINKNQGGL